MEPDVESAVGVRSTIDPSDSEPESPILDDLDLARTSANSELESYSTPRTLAL